MFKRFKYFKKVIEYLKKLKDKSLETMLNHRNKEGTNPLGLAFLEDDINFQTKTSLIFANMKEYNINDYLNNRVLVEQIYCTILSLLV